MRKVLSVVEYRDINLKEKNGVVVEVGKTIHGGNCIVHWFGGQLLERGTVSEERLEDLEVIGQIPDSDIFSEMQYKRLIVQG